jgi:hypothetical protein
MTTRALVLSCCFAACARSTELLEQHRDASTATPDVPAPDTRDACAREDASSAHDDAASPDLVLEPDLAAVDRFEAAARPHHDFCPTRIDVYGGINMQLAGCGGTAPALETLESGLFSPGAPEYDSTVAGRLLARLTDDPELVPRFGSSWRVRSCAGAKATLSQLTPPLAEDDCAANSPGDASPWQSDCADDPAPVLLAAASMLDDSCHGGGADSSAEDDSATYLRHYAMRLDALLASRGPRLAIVGPTTEWTAQPPSSEAGPWGCDWQRPQWDEVALATWASNRTEAPAGTLDVEVASHLYAEFFAHSRCCQEHDGSCSTNWFSRNSQEVANCDGAQAIVDFWYSRLKAVLKARDFQCP